MTTRIRYNDKETELQYQGDDGSWNSVDLEDGENLEWIADRLEALWQLEKRGLA